MTIENLTLKTYVEEIQIIAGGWHDSKSSHIFYQHSLDIVVNLHEDIHDKIFHSCPDARVLSLLVFALNQMAEGKIDAEKESEYTKLVQILFSSSKFAQEVFATYLSIKALDCSEHDLALARYPEEYRDYYNYMSSVIDPSFGSSYLQYLIVQNISTIVFTSPFYERFFRSLPEVVTTIKHSENSNNRLSSIVEMLSKTHSITRMLDELHEISRLTASRHGFESWDITSENGWLEASRLSRKEMEYAVSAYLLIWLPSESGLEFCDMTDEGAELFRKFAKTLGTDIQFLPADRSLATQETTVLLEAHAASRSVLENNFPPLIQNEEYLSHNLDISHRMAVGGTSPDVSELDFVSWPIGGGRSPLFVHISDLVLEFMTTQDYYAAKIMPKLDAIVLGIRQIDDVKKWYMRLPQLVFASDHNTILRAAGRLNYNRFWYLHGDYINWITNFRKPIFYTKVTFKSSVYERGGAIAKFFRLDQSSDQFYMRVFSIQASSQLISYEQSLIEKGELVEENVYETYKDKFVAAWNLCSMMWPRF